MGARFLQEAFRPETAFEYFMGESKKAIQNLSNGLVCDENPFHGIHALWADSLTHIGPKYFRYHKTLHRLHGLGLLIVCSSTLLQGDHEIERSASDYEIRTIPIVYFLIPRGEQSDRFINRLESNTELNVCVWDTKDEFTVGSSHELPNRNVKGKNFEWRIEKVWDDEHPSWHRSLVAPFSYVSQDDESVKEFLQNDNLYFCVVGMKINWNDYLERSPHMFLKKIKEFDLVKHIKQAKKPHKDRCALS